MYGYKKEVDASFKEAIEKTKEELQKEGFGVLTEIDVTATLKKKLNLDYDDYIILGACNPPFAHKALQIEKDIGLLLPCNVIVFRDNEDTYVSAVLPTKAMSMIENPDLMKIAEEIEEKLKKVIESIK
jgi:uncharacterized protein (DUF302 family)